MDRLLALTLDQIALHGYEGPPPFASSCRVSSIYFAGVKLPYLWERVAKSYEHAVDDAIKAWLWNNITNRDGYEFYLAVLTYCNSAITYLIVSQDPDAVSKPTDLGFSPEHRNPINSIEKVYANINKEDLSRLRIVAPRDLRFRAMGVRDVRQYLCTRGGVGLGLTPEAFSHHSPMA